MSLMIHDDDIFIDADFTFSTLFLQTLCAPAPADYNPEDYFDYN